ncbi:MULTISPECIES: winged helix-turn-helix domain-containing protein [Rhodomicrobium]|uniref:winged helix-turn-helix domain-containing protein n=1 Tax=Rhodomicrobium TaxID=1068 RepID=UPI000B4ABAB3|nr:MULTISPECIES: winged helix-turn-helix domain-containing protein [Rhodomicrobium]
MTAKPDISLIASLVGDPARAAMLTALMSGRALTAIELAQEAGVTQQTASSHLGKLDEGGLISIEKQGRHRYYRLSGPDVMAVLEGLTGLAARSGHLRLRTGPRDPALRRARVCYDHLAGDLAVRMFDRLAARGLIRHEGEHLHLTAEGEQFAAGFGIDLAALPKGRRPLCKGCLDWSERRSHLAGGLGAAFLSRFEALGWARRTPGSRLVTITPKGERGFAEQF